MRQAAELIDVFAAAVAAMNGNDTDDYSSVLAATLPNVQPTTPTTLTQLLQQVIGTSYRAIQFYPGHPLEISLQ